MVMLGARLLIAICGAFSLILGLLFLHLSSELSQLKSYILKKGTFVSSELASIEEEIYSSDHVIIYNRVPKTGSTSFIGLAYSLCSKNKFSVIHINTTKNVHTLSLPDQVRFAENVTFWRERKPAIYHGHIAYLDFRRFGQIQKPIFINLIRKPLDRLISYFYFLRFGDDFRPYLVRKRQGDKMVVTASYRLTIDECVEQRHPDCSAQHIWTQVPFFCGHFSECWEPGSEWALEQAKQNLVHEYILVGVTEAMQDFIAILEFSLPSVFKGFLKLYQEGSKSHLRKTIHKVMPSSKTIEKLRNIRAMRMEEEFYAFALSHFNFVKSKTIGRNVTSGALFDKGKFFSYEKIKPVKFS